MDVGLGLSLSSHELRGNGPDVWARAAVAAGFTSLWSLENPLLDQAEPLVLLTAVVCAEPTLRVGTGALVAPVRDPVFLAKQAATLDALAPGRLTLGLTIGRRTAEYELLGYDYHRRGRILDDVVAVLRQVWNGEHLDVQGECRDWRTDVPVGIPPTTPGGPSLLLGGLAPRALARAVSLGDGYLASATGGPAKALSAYTTVCDELEASGRARESFRLVANVFALIGDDPTSALSTAREIFMQRHGGAPPYDPEEVVVGGDATSVGEKLVAFAERGWDGINLVLLSSSLDQIERMAPVVSQLAGFVGVATPS